MEFINKSDLSYLDRWGYVPFYVFIVLGVLALLNIFLIFIAISSSKKAVDRDFYRILTPVLAIVSIVAIAVTPYGHSISGIIDKQNIQTKFNVSEDQKYNGVEQGYKAIIEDRDNHIIREVIFGFEDSGEPFIYETGEVNKEFIESLKK